MRFSSWPHTWASTRDEMLALTNKMSSEDLHSSANVCNARWARAQHHERRCLDGAPVQQHSLGRRHRRQLFNVVADVVTTCDATTALARGGTRALPAPSRVSPATPSRAACGRFASTLTCSARLRKCNMGRGHHVKSLLFCWADSRGAGRRPPLVSAAEFATACVRVGAGLETRRFACSRPGTPPTHFFWDQIFSQVQAHKV